MKSQKKNKQKTKKSNENFKTEKNIKAKIKSSLDELSSKTEGPEMGRVRGFLDRMIGFTKSE